MSFTRFLGKDNVYWRVMLITFGTMNFLAHTYLSGSNEKMIIGNFVGEFIKGKKYLAFPQEIKKGILLHRAIDSYTDAHPVFRKSTHRLFEQHRHYSGVLVDLIYDHFLAKNWLKYHQKSLRDFIDEFYTILKFYDSILPEKVKRLTFHMIQDDWLFSYRNKEGLKRVFEGMDKRTKGAGRFLYAMETLEIYEEAFESEFFAFFDDLCSYSIDWIKSN